MTSLNIGLIGCGSIAETYLRLAPSFPALHLVAVADLDPVAAQRRADAYGLDARSVDALLDSSDIDAVVNLTVPAAHFAVSRAILTAGKHAFSEKPIVLTQNEGAELTALAESQGLRLGAAPDTFLGGTPQQARALIDADAIGTITAGSAHFLGPGMEHWHHNPDFFFQPGGGPVLDMAPYYLTSLVNLLGPVTRVAAMANAAQKQRIIGLGPRQGETVPVDTPTTVQGLLQFATGALITLTTSWDVKAHGHNHIELYGTDGTLILPDPNFFGGALRQFDRRGAEVPLPAWEHPLTLPNGENGVDSNYRSTGLADMAQAIGQGRDHRCNANLALHVTEIMTALLLSAETGTFQTLATTCARPAALPPEAALALLVAA